MGCLISDVYLPERGNSLFVLYCEADNTSLPAILDLATRSGIRVWFGLAMDSSYWEEIKQSP